ncbi:MAG: site-specific integrase [Candidatus Gracilibacteria bacterium]|nr:site-specific integrase [Candidatus Gracilibacteria bacterium]MDD2909145.1 site-specific integrase [Candidatus Gracilibacteria bacterium]
MHKVSKLYELFSEGEELNIMSLIPEHQTPLWKYWKEFIMMSLENKKSQIFLSGVYDMIKAIIRHTGLKTIESFSDIPYLFDELIKLKHNKNWSSVTYNTYRKNLNSYFLHLERMKIINDNPIKRIQKAKEADKSQPITNIEDIEKLLTFLKEGGTLEDRRDYLYFRLAILTGARPVELLNLRIKSISDDRKEIHISGAKQNSKERIYNIESLSNVLTVYFKSVSKLGRAKELSDYLFLSAGSRGQSLTSNGINKLYQRLSKNLGFKINTYMIRRYSATALYKSGLEPNSLMDFLGHTRWATTKKYIQNSSDFTKKATDIMSGILNKS